MNDGGNYKEELVSGLLLHQCSVTSMILLLHQ
jgi:hypothetical protein